MTLYLAIDGTRRSGEGRRTHTVINPATGAAIGDLPLAERQDLDDALAASARGFARWRRTDPLERAAVLKRAAQLMRERIETIAAATTREEGKPLAEARAEITYAANLLEFFGEEARRITGKVLARPYGRQSLVLKEPIGPVAAFAPWNFPVSTPVRKLGAAIAAGCSCILKPPLEAPASALAVLEALWDAGTPGDVAQVVFGVPAEVSEHLLGSPVIRKMSFTGSTAVGKHLMRLAADSMIRTTMELGGHAPVLVFADADIEAALDALAPAKARNAGQVCTSPTRFYVEAPVYERFATGLSARLAALRVGDGMEAGTQMGPLANPRRLDAMQDLAADAVKHGATLLGGGARIGNKGYFWQPTVLRDVPADARIMNEEPFGPVAALSPFEGLEAALASANRLPFGLASYVFTGSARTALLASQGIEAGMVGLNQIAVAQVDSPFGGVKESGHGSEDGPEGIEAYLVTKAVHQ
ncbi:MAG: NAD-dependent succinate-semialdehyde dehydrogenase [Sphingomonadales bacterium]|nr:MAG: NAD-dependent succinate-semialdehyde dehydrogenase [Sphingomonadales bacterium]